MNNRNKYLDICRGFAIILVVIGHAIQMMSRTSPQSNPLFNFIYLFHMPLFIFLSGISFNFYKDKDLITTIWVRFKTLIIPFIIWHIFAGIVTNRILFDASASIEYMWAIMLNPEIGLWFLLVLFMMIVISIVVLALLKVILIRVLKRENLLMHVFNLIILIIGLILIYLPLPLEFGIKLMGDRYIFFALGIVVYNYRHYLNRFLRNKSIIYLLPLFIFFLQNRLPFYENIVIIGKLVNFFHILLPTLLSFSFIVAFLSLVRDTELPKLLERVLVYLGKISLNVYVIHWTIIFSLGQSFFQQGDLNPVTLIVTTVTLIFISILVTELMLKRSKIMSLLFLGASK